MMNPLYQNGFTIRSLKAYFSPYFVGMTRPTAEKCFLLLLGILSLQGIQSILFLYDWFLRLVSSRSLNAYYYLFTAPSLPFEKLAKVTVQLALACLSEEEDHFPVFLILDDTLQPKYGTHLAEYQTLFDHARHNGSNYLKGHCFVALVLSVPIRLEGELRYLSVPLGYRLRSREENKLDLAAAMVRQAMDAFPEGKRAVLLCDSWYPKGAVRQVVADTPQLEMVANVRKDTRLYDLPPQPTGKRGRPAQKGRELDCQTDFTFSLELGDYRIGTRKVLTNLFPEPVYAVVTVRNPEEPSGFRLFLSTLLPEEVGMAKQEMAEFCPELAEEEREALLPYCLYQYRWAIEVIFYEQKTFWSFGNYMVRSRTGIEFYVNLLAVAYSAVQLLPYRQEEYAHLRQESSLVKKQLLGTAIQQEVFFVTFVRSLEKRLISRAVWESLEHWVTKKRHF